jgi:hypothetical protein
MGIGELVQDGSQLARERIEVLHDGNGQPHQVLQIVKRASRAGGDALREPRELRLQLEEVLQRSVTEPLGERSERPGARRDAKSRAWTVHWAVGANA